MQSRPYFHVHPLHMQTCCVSVGGATGDIMDFKGLSLRKESKSEEETWKEEKEKSKMEEAASGVLLHSHKSRQRIEETDR